MAGKAIEIGITATKVAGKYLLKDAKGAVIGEIHEHPTGGEANVNNLLNKTTCSSTDLLKYLNK